MTSLEVLIENEEVIIWNEIGSFTYSIAEINNFLQAPSKSVKNVFHRDIISEIEMMRLRLLFLNYYELTKMQLIPITAGRKKEIEKLYLDLGFLESEIKEAGIIKNSFDPHLAAFIESWIEEYKETFLGIQDSFELEREEKIDLSHIGKLHSYEYNAIVTDIANQWGPEGELTENKDTMEGIVYQVFVVRNGENKNKAYASVIFPETQERRLIELKKIFDDTIASLPIYDPSHAVYLISVLKSLNLETQIVTLSREDGDYQIVLAKKPERTVYGNGKNTRDFIMALMPNLFISNWDIVWRDSNSSIFSTIGNQSLEQYMLTDEALRSFNNVLARHLIGAQIEIKDNRFYFKGDYSPERAIKAFKKLLSKSYTSDVENDVRGENSQNSVQLFCGINGESNITLSSPHHTSLSTLSERIAKQYNKWLESIETKLPSIKFNSKQNIVPAFLEQARANNVATIVGYNVISDLLRIAKGSTPFNNLDAWDGSSIFIRGGKAFVAGSFIVDVYKYLNEIFGRWGNVKLSNMMQINDVDSPLPVSVITPYLKSKGISEVKEYLTGLDFFLKISRDLDGLLDSRLQLKPEYRDLQNITQKQIDAIAALSLKCAADTEGTRQLYEKIKDELVYLALMTGVNPGQASVLSLSEMSNNLWNKFRKSRSLATPDLLNGSYKRTGEKIALYENVVLTYDNLEFLEAALHFLPKRKQELTRNFLSPESLKELNPIDAIRRYEVVKRIVLEPVDYLLDILLRNGTSLDQIKIKDGKINNIEGLLNISVYSRKNGRETPVREIEQVTIDEFNKRFIKQYGFSPGNLLEQMKKHKVNNNETPSPIYGSSGFKFYDSNDLDNNNLPTGLKGRMIILNDDKPSKNRLMVFQSDQGYTFYKGINLDYCMFSPWTKNLLTGLFEKVMNKELAGSSSSVDFTKFSEYLINGLNELITADLSKEEMPAYFAVKLPDSNKHQELPSTLKGTPVLYLKKKARKNYEINNEDNTLDTDLAWNIDEKNVLKRDLSQGSIYSRTETRASVNIEKIVSIGPKNVITEEETIMSLEEFTGLPTNEKAKYILNSEAYINILDGSILNKVLRTIMESTGIELDKRYNGAHATQVIFNIWACTNTDAPFLYTHNSQPLTWTGQPAICV